MALRSNSSMDPVLTVIESLDKTTFEGNEPGRIEALDKARALCSRLETPWESLTRIMWQEPTITTAAKLAVELGLFKHLPNSPEHLATVVGADAALLRRILRLLASGRIVKETELDTFSSTEFSAALTTSGYIGGIDNWFYGISPACLKLPQYLEDTHFRNPAGVTDPPFNSVYGNSWFGWLVSNKDRGDNFRELMAEFSAMNTFMWTEAYPLSRLTDDFPDTTTSEPPALIVDLGGGSGTSMGMLRKALFSPQDSSPKSAPLGSTYRIIVQDVSSVVAEGQKQHPQLSFMVHDFFTPQPVVGARAYFMRNILHDWPDDKARLILRYLKSAMSAGSPGKDGEGNRVKSKLLLEENVMFDRATDVASESMDFVMMILLGAKERAERDWKALLNEEGFEIIKVWRGEGTARAVVEAELMADVEVSSVD